VTSAERLTKLRSQINHHLVVGILFDKAPSDVGELERAFGVMQNKFPNFRFALVADPSVIPEEIAKQAVSSIILYRHPIFEPLLGAYEDVIISYRVDDATIDEDATVENIKKMFKSQRIDFVDRWNVDLYSDFARPIVTIFTNHPSVEDLEKNQQFYTVLAKFLYEGGVKKHPEFQFAITNTLDIVDVALDFQVEKYYPERNFFLGLIKDSDHGYLHEGVIIREKDEMEQVLTAETIDQFVSDYKLGNLQAYLKTEKLDPTPFFAGNILHVYGSNFINLVKDRKYAPAEDYKGLILLFTKQNCPKCEWTEAYFDRLAQEFGSEDFQFAIMNVDKNYPTSDLRQFLYNENEPMLQFLAVLPDGGQIKKFQKENDTFEKLQEFIENVKYLVRYQKTEAAGKAEKKAEEEVISSDQNNATKTEL
jgi:thiol-disulfide isomerase/thioredoxin